MRSRSAGLTLTLALAAPALAAQMPPDEFKFDDGTIFTWTVTTPHEYLGEAKIGRTLWGDWKEINFSVFIVDDSVDALNAKVTITNRNTKIGISLFGGFIFPNDDALMIYFEPGEKVPKDKNEIEFSFSRADSWLSVSDYFYREDDDGNGYGWVFYSAAIFSKSELAEFKKSGNLPATLPLEDISETDLSSLKAVLSGTSAPAPAPSTPAPATPAPAKPAPGSTATLKTTEGLVSVIPPNPTAGQDLAYTVQAGESLWGIAFNYYGTMSGNVVAKIYKANAEYFKKTKGVLEAGAVITLPAKGLINPVSQGSLDKAAGVYLVKAGDTLCKIAKLYYGDANAWSKIYEANKGRVKNKDMIYEKQWLVIPE